MIKTKLRDHNVSWHPAEAARGLDSSLAGSGLFGGKLAHDSALVVSRYIAE